MLYYFQNEQNQSQIITPTLKTGSRDARILVSLPRQIRPVLTTIDMKSSKAVKSIKRKDPFAKKKLAKKSSKINEFRDITPQSNENPFWSDKIKFKEGIENSELANEEPKMMSIEEINKSIISNIDKIII